MTTETKVLQKRELTKIVDLIEEDYVKEVAYNAISEIYEHTSIPEQSDISILNLEYREGGKVYITFKWAVDSKQESDTGGWNPTCEKRKELFDYSSEKFQQSIFDFLENTIKTNF